MAFARPIATGARALAARRAPPATRPQVRFASQLYPTTSQRWDDAMLQAESVAGDSSNFSGLQRWVSGEFTSITKYLQRLVGTSHPMLETAKRCAYIGEGRMGSAQVRGLTVILTSKAVAELARHTCPQSSRHRDMDELTKNQISLAEMTEMTYSAYMIHRGVMDLRMHGLESAAGVGGVGGVGCVQQALADLDAQQAKALHYGNKVSVLCGDFLLAYVMRGLGDLFSSKVVDLVASAITDFMEGEFLLLDDWRAENYLLSRNSRDLARWMRRSQATIGSLQGNTCQASLVLANINGKLQHDALQLGRNMGLAWQAHTELQPFLSDSYEPIELPEMPPYPAFDLNCLPVLLFLRQAHQNNRNFRLMLNDIKSLDLAGPATVNATINQHHHREPVNYEKLHNLVLNQAGAVDETLRIIKEHSTRALMHLDSFPASEAKEVLANICESLYRK